MRGAENKQQSWEGAREQIEWSTEQQPPGENQELQQWEDLADFKQSKQASRAKQVQISIAAFPCLLQQGTAIGPIASPLMTRGACAFGRGSRRDGQVVLAGITATFCGTCA